MSEPKQLTELRRKVNAKTREIEALVASTYGLGDIKSLDRAALRGLEIEVEKMIEKYKESLHEGDNVEEWRAKDARLLARRSVNYCKRATALPKRFWTCRTTPMTMDDAGRDGAQVPAALAAHRSLATSP
jgi:hypothetical protein